MSYSVLMSVYYKEKAEFLKESIDSMLAQTVLSDDFVLVCDGQLTPELDDAIDGLKKSRPALFQIVKLSQNVGLGSALNVGLGYCKNELIARMDSDDVAILNRCERQLVCFAAGADIVSGTVEEFSDEPSVVTARRVLPVGHVEILKFARRRNPFNHPCVMFRKSLALAAGGYQPFYLCEDYYLWVRMLQTGAIGQNILEPLLHMRAGEDMYKRRAGIKYLKTMLKFRWQLKTIGFSGWSDFLVSGVAQIISCMLPNNLRQKMYGVVLRK